MFLTSNGMYGYHTFSNDKITRKSNNKFQCKKEFGKKQHGIVGPYKIVFLRQIVAQDLLMQS